jgi:predicted Rossmann fold flavoprotein
MPENQDPTSVLIIGASAAGLMCAIEAAKRQRRVLVLDHANKPGKKILMSGGGRCNFTNYTITADNYISHNPHFCKSALSRFSQWNFIQLVEQYQIPYHERKHGQLFCDNSARDILDMLLSECNKYGVEIRLNTTIENIKQNDSSRFITKIIHNKEQQWIDSESLVVATGGLSIPKMCASPLGYQIAEQFNIKIWPTRAGLVPFTLHEKDKQQFSHLTGIAVDATVECNQQQFRENLLFTHRGLSGPAILQASSYWQPGDSIIVNLLPDVELKEILVDARKDTPQRKLKSILVQYLPKRLITAFIETDYLDNDLQNLSQQDLNNVCAALQNWVLQPNGTEGYRTAEVTLGGVDCDCLSSKTMQTTTVKGLFFIGEVVDVTGWLGGYNFQWAWSSGWSAGQYV